MDSLLNSQWTSSTWTNHDNLFSYPSSTDRLFLAKVTEFRSREKLGCKLRQCDPRALMVCLKGGKHIYPLFQYATSRDQTRVTFSKRALHKFTHWGPHQHEWQCGVVRGLKMIIQDIWLLYPAQQCSRKHSLQRGLAKVYFDLDFSLWQQVTNYSSDKMAIRNFLKL